MSVIVIYDNGTYEDRNEEFLLLKSRKIWITSIHFYGKRH